MVTYSSLTSIIQSRDYALAISPGFFCFYCQVGALHAMEEAGMLRVTHCSGSSAGALVTGFLSSGMLPSQMVEPVLSIRREDMWDIGGIGGLLRGQKFQELLEKHLPQKNFEDCVIPVGMTTYDLLRFRTNIITKGNLATAIRASCCFPVLFSPVLIDNFPQIDGGLFDACGLMGLPGIPDSKLVVNIVMGRTRLSLSQPLPNSQLLTICLENFPLVHPGTMSTTGRAVYKIARAVMHKALKGERHFIVQMSSNHWIAYLDGLSVSPEEADMLYPDEVPSSSSSSSSSSPPSPPPSSSSSTAATPASKESPLTNSNKKRQRDAITNKKIDESDKTEVVTSKSETTKKLRKKRK